MICLVKPGSHSNFTLKSVETWTINFLPETRSHLQFDDFMLSDNTSGGGSFYVKCFTIRLMNNKFIFSPALTHGVEWAQSTN